MDAPASSIEPPASGPSAASTTSVLLPTSARKTNVVPREILVLLIGPEDAARAGVGVARHTT